MKIVIQVVNNATLSVDGKTVSQIGKGLCVYFGVEKGDERKDADFVVKKICNMRIFKDDNDKMNLSVKDIKGEVLFISQFTLLANVSHGNRPDFFKAEQPDKAKEIYEYAQGLFALYGVPVKTGVFGADMKIKQENDGPVTIIF